MDDRKLTFIIVPHGDLETRSVEISYRALKWLLGGTVLLVGMFAVMASSWWFIGAQAARVPGLEREVARLEQERAKVAELARTLSEVEEQYERVRKLLGADTPARGDEPLLPPLRAPARPREQRPAEGASLPQAWPLAGAGFITRELRGGEGTHTGLDIAVAQDTYIRAAGGGTVLDAGADEVYGNFVVIDHGAGVESLYAHASRLFVSRGDTVELRQVIALSGSTGRSTAPHLHFEIRRDGEAVDPLQFVRRP
jgi:murein DD-endopeptidase MepM/ murein hydrolase activator NlpD